MRTVTTRTIAGRVSSAGAITAGPAIPVQKAGTGNYAMYFPATFRLTSIVVSCNDISRMATASIAAGNQQVNVLTVLSNTSAAEDRPFYYTATGDGYL